MFEGSFFHVDSSYMVVLIPGQLWCPRFYLKHIGGAGAGISFAWLPRLVLCDHTGNVIVT